MPRNLEAVFHQGWNQPHSLLGTFFVCVWGGVVSLFFCGFFVSLFLLVLSVVFLLLVILFLAFGVNPLPRHGILVS